jgi:hypothetical protein
MTDDVLEPSELLKVTNFLEGNTSFTDSEMRHRVSERLQTIDDEFTEIEPPKSDGIVQPKTGDFCSGFVVALLLVAFLFFLGAGTLFHFTILK